MGFTQKRVSNSNAQPRNRRDGGLLARPPARLQPFTLTLSHLTIRLKL